MSTEIITVQNVRGYVDANNTAWLNAADVARGLGFVEVKKDRVATSGDKPYEAIRWARVNGYLAEFGFPQKVGEKDFIPENMVYRLAMKANNETAQTFQALIADEILPTIRRTGSYSVKAKVSTPFADKVIDIGETARALQTYITGLKGGMALAQAIAFAEANDGCNYDPIKRLLPPAEHDTGYLNATQVGEKLGYGTRATAARKANADLSLFGLQERQGRDWRLTERGKQFGEEYPYSRNGHSGYQIRWNEKVFNELSFKE